MSGWLAPAGPALTAFESDMALFLGVRHAVALSSGTAALHMGLRYLGVREGDVVLVPTTTFAATAFAVTYLAATPVFIDIEPVGWGMDPSLTVDAIKHLRRSGLRVAAAIPVDLYGSPADYSHIMPALRELDVPVLEDAAEGLGARHQAAPVGAFGEAATLSFNGNKIITTSGGGMLVTDNADFAQRVRYWSTQARQDAPWYEHEEIGYNYRMSNVLAALGRSQLSRVDELVRRRRNVRSQYSSMLSEIPGVTLQADPPWGTSNAWLSVARFDRSLHLGASEKVRTVLESANVESRPVWKPMHRQPVFKDNASFLNGEADLLHEEGLCLPSGPNVTDEDVRHICQLVTGALYS